MKKGSKIYVEGQLQTRKWTDKEGQDRYPTEIVLGRFNGQLTMLDSSGGEGFGGGPDDDTAPAPRVIGGWHVARRRWRWWWPCAGDARSRRRSVLSGGFLSDGFGRSRYIRGETPDTVCIPRKAIVAIDIADRCVARGLDDPRRDRQAVVV